MGSWISVKMCVKMPKIMPITQTPPVASAIIPRLKAPTMEMQSQLRFILFSSPNTRPRRRREPDHQEADQQHQLEEAGGANPPAPPR